MEELNLVYGYDGFPFKMTLRVSAQDATQRWQERHPLAGLAEFQWVNGRWTGGHGNLSDPCHWQEGYWEVTPLYCRTRTRAVWGLKADPAGSVFEPGVGPCAR